MSVKAKANLMGELGADLGWTDKSTDKDWSHYSGKEEGATVVVFFDGIEIPSYKWWWENLKVSAKVGDARRRSIESSIHRQQSNKRQVDAALGPERSRARPPTEEQDLLAEDLWGSHTPLRQASPGNARSLSRGRQAQPRRPESVNRSISTPTRLSKYLNYEQEPLQWNESARARSPAPNGKPMTSTVPAAQRFSMASTTTSSNAGMLDHRSKDFETSPLTNPQRNSLQRKTASPSLRQAS